MWIHLQSASFLTPSPTGATCHDYCITVSISDACPDTVSILHPHTYLHTVSVPSINLASQSELYHTVCAPLKLRISLAATPIGVLRRPRCRATIHSSISPHAVVHFPDRVQNPPTHPVSHMPVTCLNMFSRPSSSPLLFRRPYHRLAGIPI